jgi:hypothetical protein
MKMRAIGLVFAIFVVAVSLHSADDALVGTWKLNVAKSKYDPGSPRRSGVSKYASSGANSLKFIQDVVSATGEKTHNEGSIAFDGKEHPMQAAGTAETNRRIDARTTERTRTMNGKLVNYLLRVVSPDGKTLAVKQVGIDASGKPLSTIEVYDKQ